MLKQNYSEELEYLNKLQKIDHDFNVIIEQKGLLPESIRTLKESLAQMANEKEQKKAIIKKEKEEVSQARKKSKEMAKDIVSCEEDLLKAKNDRAYEAVNDDLALLKVELNLLKRHITQQQKEIQKKNEEIEALSEQEKIKKNSLAIKEEKLKAIEVKTQDEEKALEEERKKIITQMDQSVYARYAKVHARSKGAAVNIVENACAGCCVVINQQRQIEVKLQRNIFQCENCGRLLLYVIEPAKKPPKKRVRGASAKRLARTA